MADGEPIGDAPQRRGGCATVRTRTPRRHGCFCGEISLLIRLAEEDAAGAGGAGEDAFTGRFVLEIGVGRDAADRDL